jgi:hypothetical protein
MALKDDLSTKMDTGGMTTTFASKVTTVEGDLNGISPPPIDRDAFANAGASAAAPGETLRSSADSLGAQLTQIAGRLPIAKDTLAPITATLEVVESVITADLEKEFRALGDNLAKELSGTTDEGMLGAFLKVADLFGKSSQVQQWKNLAKAFANLTGVQIPEAALSTPNLAPGVAAMARFFGGLMAEHTIVSETERLALIAAAQIDADRIATSSDGVLAFFRPGNPSIEELIAGTDASNPSQVDTAVTAVRQLRLRLEAWSGQLSESLAFGEATLTFMDVPALRADLDHAARVLRQADAGAIERLFTSIAGAFGSVVPQDVLSGPDFSLEELIARLENLAQPLAEKISSLGTEIVSEPLTRALDVALNIPNRLGDAIQQVNAAIAAALEGVRGAIAALPLDAVRDALQDVARVIANAVKQIGELIAALKNLLTQAANTLQTVLGNADQALAELRDAMKALFHDAVEFVNGLHIDQVVGDIAGKAQQLADAIGRASMKPYFDTAGSAISTATDVVTAVPFELLPDSMEEEVVDAIRPVKTADSEALKNDIKALLEIGPDGKFVLRADIEESIQDIQQKFDDLLAEIRRRNPRLALAAVDEQLARLGEKIRALSLQIDLSPIHDAVRQVKSAVEALDPDAVLQPVRRAFDQVQAGLNEFAPEKLIAPVEARWNEARQRLLELSRLQHWAQTLDELSVQAKELIDQFDLSDFGPELDETLNEVLSTLDDLPHLHSASAFGGVIASMFQGSGLRVAPLSFEAVLGWMDGASGTADLQARARRASEAVSTSGAVLQALDLPSVITRLNANLQSLREAAARMSAGAGKDRIVAETDLIDLARMTGPFLANHVRFFEVLEQSRNQIVQLTAAGFSEVDDSLVQLRRAWAPMSAIIDSFARAFSKAGISGFDVGLGEVIRRILSTTPPSRIVAIVAPLVTAVRQRLNAFVGAVIAPLRAAAQRLLDILNSLTLDALKQGLTDIHTAVAGQIMQFHPDQLLAGPLAEFQAVRIQVLQFDPAGDIQRILDNVSKTAERVLKNLNLEELLAEPLQLYDQVLALLEGLQPAHMLRPVLDQLERIAGEVDAGLTNTVTAFRGLQEALPDRIGSTSLSASAST